MPQKQMMAGSPGDGLREWTNRYPNAGTSPRDCGYRFGLLAIRHYRVCAILIVALMALNVFWNLSGTAISSLDEARYGVDASEMLQSHRLLIPTYAGQPEYWNLKPPLGYWPIEAAFAVLGPTVLALRLTSALSAIAAVWLTMSFCKPRLGRRAALLAGLALATCFGFLNGHGARSGDLDALLTLLMMLALLLLPKLGDSRLHRLAWSGVMALGFLLKSFAVLPFLLATGICVIWDARGRLRWREWWPALCVFVAIVGAWALARTLADGSGHYVGRMFYEDLLQRSTQNIDGGATQPLGYVEGVFDRFAPWPLFLLAAWPLARRRLRGACTTGVLSPRQPVALAAPARHLSLRWRLAIWVCVPLCMFSVARTHHHWYLDPMYPAMAMLAASAALTVLRRLPPAIALGVLALVSMGCEARVLGRIVLKDQRPPYQQFLTQLRAWRAPRGTILETAFPLGHSERFILQVLDGFTIRDYQVDVYSLAVPTGEHRLILDASRDGFAALRGAYAPQVLARSQQYVLFSLNPATQKALRPGLLAPVADAGRP